MVEEAVEIVIVVIVFTGIFCFWLGLSHMIYLAYCQSCCGQHRSENNAERTQATFYVTEEAPETLECYQEDQYPSIVFVTNDSIIK